MVERPVEDYRGPIHTVPPFSLLLTPSDSTLVRRLDRPTTSLELEVPEKVSTRDETSGGGGNRVRLRRYRPNYFIPDIRGRLDGGQKQLSKWTCICVGKQMCNEYRRKHVIGLSTHQRCFRHVGSFGLYK